MPQIKINGVEHTIEADPQMPLLWAIRDIVGLTGAKFGCGVGACGATENQRSSQMIARTIRRLSPAVVLVTIVASVPSVWVKAADNAKPYTIKNGVVDPHTFTGYLHYEGTCYWCHGQDATGSTFAPSLVDALKTLSHDEFNNIVINGGVVGGRAVGYGTSNVS